MAHGRTLELGPVSRFMGILNVTPDSFSDGGEFASLEKALAQAEKMIAQGADIIDVGGESTRPGAQTVSEQVEQQRVLPVIEALAKRFDVCISVDTYRRGTAKNALEAGAHIVNDVHGLRENEKISGTIAQFSAGVCIMHNSRDRDVNEDIISDQIEYFDQSLKTAESAGIKPEQIVLDPGFGFGKDAHVNFTILGGLEQLNATGYPFLAGTSRKRFTGEMLGSEDSRKNRDIVTSATNVIARMAGCSIFRVHEVGLNKHALQMADAVLDKRNTY